jgi:hypothetical protein
MQRQIHQRTIKTLVTILDVFLANALDLGTNLRSLVVAGEASEGLASGFHTQVSRRLETVLVRNFIGLHFHHGYTALHYSYTQEHKKITGSEGGHWILT